MASRKNHLARTRALAQLAREFPRRFGELVEVFADLGPDNKLAQARRRADLLENVRQYHADKRHR